MKVTVSQKGQIVIPVKLRKKLGIERGAKLDVRERAGHIEMQILPKHPILLLKGKLKGKTSLAGELLKERAKDRKRENAS